MPPTEDKKGFWKKLTSRLQKVAPMVLAGVGDQLGGPAEWGLEALARLIAGSSISEDREEVAKKIVENPDLMVKLETIALEKERLYIAAKEAELQADTDRIKTVNETMRSEAGADDKWTRRWRPFWGFVSGACWGALALSMVVAILDVAFWGGDAAVITVIGDAFAGMTLFWGVATAILGISAYTRGREKIERVKREGPC